MRYHIRSTIVILLLCTAFLSAKAYTQDLPDFTELAKTNSPAVVNISSTSKPQVQNEKRPQEFSHPDLPEGPLSDFLRRFFEGQTPRDGGPRNPRTSLGSGFIISTDGYVITNSHVVKAADEIIVRMSDRSEYSAKLIGDDPRSDIAVLKIESTRPFPKVKFGNSDSLEVGEWVLAIGSPFGFDYSVTAGIVSAKGRSLPNENYVPFIQTDVAINPGNSGGPLFNMKGEVVGVNSQIYSRTGGFMGVSFAIPTRVVLDVYEQLKEKGSVTRGWLGVLIQDVTQELAESFAMEKPMGALVSQVLESSPAKKGGLQAGDIITRFSGKRISKSSDLPPLVGTARVGDKIPVNIVRAGKKKKLEIVIGALPTDEVAASPKPEKNREKDEYNDKLGIKVQELTDTQRQRSGIDKGGLIVVSVQQGAAQDAGIRRGDILLQLDGANIETKEQFSVLTSKLEDDKTYACLIQREQGPTFIAIKIGSTKD